MVAFPAWAAIRTVKEKIGTWKGYERYRELDPSVTREQWATYIGQARAALANKVLEVTRPLNRIPTSDEVLPYDTKKATGYLQQVEVHVMDRDTGIPSVRFYSFRTDTLRSRGWVTNKAENSYRDAASDNPEDYPEEILGASYAGTFRLTPTG